MDGTIDGMEDDTVDRLHVIRQQCLTRNGSAVRGRTLVEQS